ncbi:MAG TPA: DUF4124 domain-containing protein [Steroidobacteraceae bacterium]|jgi:hypothetical protein|nr:DUF4124 domain-containing protein [Steroidobacteraceae bacterium]
MNCTPRRLLLFLSAAMLASGIASAAPQSKGPVTYRWVDEQGVVHYGDTVPPQYAAKDREIINGDGVPVGHLDAQKTAEQLAAEEHQRVEMIKQKEHDSFLVTTYTSVKDIEALRDARLEQLRAQQGAAEQYVESLRSRLTALEARALTYRPYSDNANARRMPDDLAENLVRTADELHEQSTSVAARASQEAEMRAQFDADIARYRELHTIHSAP